MIAASAGLMLLFVPILIIGMLVRLNLGRPVWFAQERGRSWWRALQRTLPALTARIAAESAEVHALYGTEPGKVSFANNCLLARRLVERGVRFVQLFDSGWDIHGTNPTDDLVTQFPKKAAEIDRPLAALLLDLERRGLLDETLVVFGGEFGRTPMNEARDGSKFLGRDHNPHCFSLLRHQCLCCGGQGR
ncbi:MAG: DUF1501 domain-containing protein [Rhodospirillales bacterium]|nr:DUF1501 domain-containing protein [Rhodospirillales bacterium]